MVLCLHGVCTGGVALQLWEPIPCPLGWRKIGGYLEWWGGKTIASRCSRMGGNVCAALGAAQGKGRTLVTRWLELLGGRLQAGEPGAHWPGHRWPPLPASLLSCQSLLIGIPPCAHQGAETSMSAMQDYFNLKSPSLHFLPPTCPIHPASSHLWGLRTEVSGLPGLSPLF